MALLSSSALCFAIDLSPEGKDKTLSIDEDGVLSTNQNFWLHIQR